MTHLQQNEQVTENTRIDEVSDFNSPLPRTIANNYLERSNQEASPKIPAWSSEEELDEAVLLVLTNRMEGEGISQQKETLALLKEYQKSDQTEKLALVDQLARGIHPGTQPHHAVTTILNRASDLVQDTQFFDLNASSLSAREKNDLTKQRLVTGAEDFVDTKLSENQKRSPVDWASAPASEQSVANLADTARDYARQQLSALPGKKEIEQRIWKTWNETGTFDAGAFHLSNERATHETLLQDLRSGKTLNEKVFAVQKYLVHLNLPASTTPEGEAPSNFDVEIATDRFRALCAGR